MSVAGTHVPALYPIHFQWLAPKPPSHHSFPWASSWAHHMPHCQRAPVLHAPLAPGSSHSDITVAAPHTVPDGPSHKEDSGLGPQAGPGRSVIAHCACPRRGTVSTSGWGAGVHRGSGPRSHRRSPYPKSCGAVPFVHSRTSTNSGAIDSSPAHRWLGLEEALGEASGSRPF